MNGIVLIVAFLLAAGVTFAANWLALTPWRRNRDKHWTEQARLVYPVFTAARSNLIAVPGILMLGTLLLWPANTCLWGFAGVLSFFGANLANIFLMHEVFPRISWPDSLRQSITGFLQTTLRMAVLVAAVILMPSYLDLQADFFAVLIVLVATGWVTRVSSWFAGTVGLFEPAPERLRKITQGVSAKMKIRFRRILLMRSPRAHAFAFPGRGLLVFTSRLLALLTDTELASVCAHEIAHLSESRGMRTCRSISSIAFLPWIFVSPLFNQLGLWALLLLVVNTVVCVRISKWISRKLEVRADLLAKAIEDGPGTYARALLRLYEDSLLPAVIAKKHRHPDLYERLLAAGVTCSELHHLNNRYRFVRAIISSGCHPGFPEADARALDGLACAIVCRACLPPRGTRHFNPSAQFPSFSI